MELLVLLGFFVTLNVLVALGLSVDSRNAGLANPPDNPHLRPWVE